MEVNFKTLTPPLAGRVRGGGRAERDLQAAEEEASSAINDLENGLESIEPPQVVPETEGGASDAAKKTTMKADGGPVSPLHPIEI